MLFLKPKPKEKFKYLPAFNSAKFFGEKKRKTELDYKPKVKVLKPSKSAEKIIAQTIQSLELKGQNLTKLPAIKNVRRAS